ncbi:MAG: ABC transporter permease subunit, partial [Chloroflexota bacterium]
MTVATTATVPATPAPAARRGLRVTPGLAAMGLLTAVVAVLVLLPLAMLLYGSFWTARPGFPGAFTLANYITAYTSLDTYRLFLTTVAVMGVKTALAGGLAAALAWIVTRTDTPLRGLLEVLIIVPFFVPSLLEAIGWIMLLSPNTGTINVLIKQITGATSPLNIFGLGGMLWVLTLSSTSFIFLFLVAALRNMDAALEEAARTSGAGRLRTARMVTLPLAAPSRLGGLV